MSLPWQVTTTGAGGAPVKKPFTWSYSRLKNFRACPKKHYHTDLIKDAKQEESEALTYGNAVHDAMAKRCQKGTPLPAPFRDFETEAARFAAPVPGMQLLVEQSMGLRRDFTACGFFDPKVWLRVKVDGVKIGQQAAVAIDWKTGKINEESEQLALTAAVVFATYPNIQKVLTEYIWLGNNARTRVIFTRPMMVDLWNHLMPELNAYEQAYLQDNFPPKPGGLCKSWCTVKACPFWGVGAPR